MLSITIDAEMEQHLEALGAMTADSKTELARRRLIEALREDREDQAWARIAEQRLEQAEKTYSLEEVAHDLGVDS